jgi:hypothetical protein
MLTKTLIKNDSTHITANDQINHGAVKIKGNGFVGLLILSLHEAA